LLLKNSKKPHYQKKIKNLSYYQILKKLEPSFDDQEKIFNYCRKKSIIFLSTPYDSESLDFLIKLGVPAIKISSSDLTNHLLLEKVVRKRKPIILSTGLSNLKEVDLTFDFLTRNRMKNKLIILQTTSDYPTKFDEVNLLVIKEYKKRYGIPVGLSDHTTDYLASIGAIALGANVVEKHFTLDKSMKGPDHKASLSPIEFKNWIKKIREMELLMGSNRKKITQSELQNIAMKKVLVINPAKKGTIITKKLLEAKRGERNGILPLSTNIKRIMGKKLLRDIKEPTSFTWKMIRE